MVAPNVSQVPVINQFFCLFFFALSSYNDNNQFIYSAAGHMIAPKEQFLRAISPTETQLNVHPEGMWV